VRNRSGVAFVVGIFVAASAAFASTNAQVPLSNLSFDTATIEPSSAHFPVDLKQVMARKIGVSFAGSRAEFRYMSLRNLILYAYGVNSMQVKWPEWLADDGDPYDIVATMPAGASKADAPAMLQALLEDRFGLVAHRESKSQQVMALVVAKGGPKLVESASIVPPAWGTPVAQYDRVVGTKDGPVYIYWNGHEGSTLKASMTMAGFADLLTNILNAGDSRGKSASDMHEYRGDWQTVVDQTGLKGTYEVAVNSSLSPGLIFLRAAAGSGIVTTRKGQISPDMLALISPPQPGEELDPAIFASVQKLGLKLELGKAKTEQLVVDHVEKTPTAN